MFNRDPLAKATAELLLSAEEVTKEVGRKKDIILRAEESIIEAQNAIAEAKTALSM